MKRVAAFFDLDGTLTTGHVYGSVAKVRMRHPAGAMRATAYLLCHFAMLVPHRLGLLDTTRFFVSWMVALAGLLKGMRTSEATSLFQEVADDLMHDAREDVVASLREHRGQGHLTVMVSGTFLPLLEEVGRRLGVEHMVGTPLEVHDGRYTGRLAAPLCFGEEKARQVQSFLKQAGIDVDMAASYAYADRRYDIPLLEMVGHPVAVYPDEALLAHARQKGWQVRGEGRA